MSFDADAVAHAYAEGAHDYAAKFGDELSTNEFDRAVVEDAISGLPVPSSILDVGCGPGQVSALVRDRGHRSFAVDLTMEMLVVARERQAADALVRTDERSLPVAAAACDAAVCWYSLHNLPRPLLPAALAELRRTLRVGGRLVIATHAGAGEEWHDTEWAGRAERVVITYYGPDELADLVRAAGFDSLDRRARDPLPHEHQVQKLYVTATAA